MISASSVSSSIAAISRTIVRPLHPRRPASDILPSRAEPPSSASKQTLFLLFASVFVELLLVQSRDAEEHDEEDHEEDSEESKLRPEVDDAEEGEVDSDAVEEGADGRGSADEVADGVVVALGAGLDGVAVVAAVGLVGALAGAVAEGLGAEGGVLRCDDHGERVVERQDDESE